MQVDRQKIDQPISWIRYGQFGREEGALIIGTKSMEIESFVSVLFIGNDNGNLNNDITRDLIKSQETSY